MEDAETAKHCLFGKCQDIKLSLINGGNYEFPLASKQKTKVCDNICMYVFVRERTESLTYIANRVYERSAFLDKLKELKIEYSDFKEVRIKFCILSS